MEYKREPSFWWIVGKEFLSLTIAGFLGIWVWKKNDALTYLSQLFSFQHFLLNVIYGVSLALIFSLFVLFLSNFHLILFPHNRLTDPLIRWSKKKGAPIFIGVCSGFSEEWVFRALLFSLLCNWIHPFLAIILSSFIFMSLHIPQYKGYFFIHCYILFFSIVITIAFFQTKSIWTVFICHSLYNTILFYLLRNGKLSTS